MDAYLEIETKNQNQKEIEKKIREKSPRKQSGRLAYARNSLLSVL